MGHDTDVNGVGTLLNVGWNADPFPTNTTAPSVGLRFEFNRNDDASSGESSGRKRAGVGVGVGSAGGNVTLDFVYTTYSTTTRPLQVTSVFNMASDVFCNQAVNAIDWSCAYVPCGMVAFVFVFVVICVMCVFVVVYVCVSLALSLALALSLLLSRYICAPVCGSLLCDDMCTRRQSTHSPTCMLDIPS